MVKKLLVVTYSVLCYALFLASFVYLVGFLINWGVPKSIDSAASVDWLLAVTVDLALIGLFGLQHTLMARSAFKQLWVRLIPQYIERSTYVLFSTLVFILIFIFWQPVTAPLWSIETGILNVLAWSLFVLGWTLLLFSTFVIDHFELFGLRQTWEHLTGRKSPPHKFQTPGPYRWVRHPMMTGLLLIFWATPHMSLGHLTFAAGMTAYILVGLLYEERDLIKAFKAHYRAYQTAVPRLLPRLTPFDREK